MESNNKNFTLEASTSTNIGSLPIHLWGNILARLPIQTLAQSCVRVCKSWHDIIHDRHFISMQLSNSQQRTYLLSTVYNNTVKVNGKPAVLYSSVQDRHTFGFFLAQSLRWASNAFDDEHSSSPPQVTSYVNGVFLIDVPGKLMLWNPSIRKKLNLPPNPANYIHKRYNNQVCVKNYLGFDPRQCDFKVAKLFYLPSSLQPQEVMIYALTTNAWKPRLYTIPNNVIVNWRMTHRKPVFTTSQATGALHWIVDDQGIIVSLNLSTESFSFFTLPHISDGNLRFHFNLRGSLAVFDMSHSRNCIWLRQKDGWAEWYSGGADRNNNYDFFKDVKNDAEHMFLFCEDEDSHKFLINTCGKIYCYDLATHQRKRLDQSIDDSLYIRHMGMYTESLALYDRPKLSCTYVDAQLRLLDM